jgi:diguanylate cyclase (GGDEF)-like protein
VILKDALDALRIAFANFEQAARSDDKTPLQNALALSEAKENFAASENSPNVVIFADASHLKAINTAHGQPGGDAAINQIGILIQELCVEKCKAQAFRPSGDEFVILLHIKFLDALKSVTKSFADCQVPFEGRSFSVGVSFGIAVSDGSLEFEKVISRAEAACKKAKIQGSGTYLEWTEEIEQTVFKGLRETCHNCGTINDCNVPQEMKLERLISCAACGTKFKSVNP